MNNYREGLKKRRKKELWRDQWEPIDQKKIWNGQKGLTTDSKEEEKCRQKTKGRQKVLHLTDNEK